MTNAKNIVYSTSGPDSKTGRITITANLKIYATSECEPHEAIRNKDEIEKLLRFKLADVLFADAKRVLTDLYMTARRPPLKGSIPACDDYLAAIKERFELVRSLLAIADNEDP